MSHNPEEILKSIVKNEDLIRYHKGWGFYIETPFKSIHKIGLIQYPGKSFLELALIFGDTQEQAKAFYKLKPDINFLLESKWHLKSNFHFSFVQTNLVWFATPTSPLDYIKFWEENIDLLHQHNIDEIPDFLDLLARKNIILLDKSKEDELQDVIFDKDYSTLNICAGFAVLFRIENKEVEDLKKNWELRQFFIHKINEGLKVIRERGD